MQRNLHLPVLLMLLLVALPVLGQDENQPTPTPIGDQGETPAVAAPPTAADSAFKKLQRDFSTLYTSLQNSRGIRDEDRPTIQAFLDRVRQFTDSWPDHTGGVAMKLQLCKWLKEDDRIGDLYERLMELKPDDARIALSWVRHQETSADTELADDEQLEPYRRLHARFPDNTEICVALARRLKDSLHYDEAIELLSTGQFGPEQEPEAVFTLADCLFAVTFGYGFNAIDRSAWPRYRVPEAVLRAVPRSADRRAGDPPSRGRGRRSAAREVPDGPRRDNSRTA